MKERWEVYKKRLFAWLLDHDQEFKRERPTLHTYTHDELRQRAVRNPAFDLSYFAHDLPIQGYYNAYKNAPK